MSKLTTCLLFKNGDARAAAEFYAATFPDSRVDRIVSSPLDLSDGNKEGADLVVDFTVLGQTFLGLNGGPPDAPNMSVSFQVYTDDQAETDRYWNAIVGGGGKPSMCGWCSDRWGYSWQITPRALMKAIGDPDRAAASRAMEAMMTMSNIDIAAIERAHRGEAA